MILILCYQATAQQVQLITDDVTKSQYENKSYLVVKSLRIMPGFTVPSGTTWFARVHSDAVAPTAASADKNFVRTEAVLDAGVTTEAQVKSLTLPGKATSYRYADGLGRAIQTVIAGGSAGAKDIVQPMYYDALGRESRHYLSYATATATPGSYKSGSTTDQGSYYMAPPGKVKDDAKAYSETFFDNSPLQRIIQTKAVGSAWSAKPVNFGFKLNDASTVSIWRIENGLPKSVEYYPANSLTIEESTDEELKISRTYSDFLGRIVMKEAQAPGGGWSQTYYVVNVYGNTQFVIPPMAVSNLVPDQTFADKWFFQFEFDAYRRRTGVKAPGVGWVYTVYDKLDRPVLSQDANQRTRSEWMFIKYDALNRQVYSGTYVTASTRSSLVNTLSTASAYEVRNTSALGYTLTQAFPTTSVEGDILSVSYYDNYSFKDNVGWDAEANSYAFVAETDFASSNFSTVKDMRTGGKVRILGSSPAKWLNDVVYYDDYYRMLQTITENHFGKVDRVTSKYTFAGQVIKKMYVHSNAYSQTITLRERYTYDTNSRLVNTYHQVNNQSEILLSSIEYNDLGQVVDKKIHSTDGGATSLQSIDYRYDIQGRVININNTSVDAGDASDYFGETLGFNQDPYGSTGRYDGLISGVSWKHDLSPKDRIYGFSYDKSALTGASYKVNNGLIPQTGVFNEDGLTYDLNGNILSLKRNSGLKTSTPIDNLTYTYSSTIGNQLVKVTDPLGTAGFADGNTTGDDYAYDANGNLVKDKNKGIKKNVDDPGIEYNVFNEPEKITFASGDYITFVYDGNGRKLSQKYYASGGTPQGQIDYVGNFIYENGATPTSILHSEGRLVSAANDNLITNTTTREANASTGFGTTGSVLLSSYTTGSPAQTYVRATCNQNNGTAEVAPIGGTITVTPGATYVFKLLGYQGVGTSAGLIVRQAGGAVISSGTILKIGAANEDFVSCTFTVPAGVTQIQLGVAWATPVSGNIVYINYVAFYRSEWEYQYFMNDHLGTPRVVLQTQPSTKTFSATMERSNHPDENDRFLNLDINKEVNTVPAANATPGGAYSYVLNASTHVGPGRSFKVLPGDKFNANVNSYYATGGSYSAGNAAAMALQVATALANGVAGAIDGVTTPAYTTTGNPAFALGPNQGTTRPSAFLNYILFDETYTPLEAKSQPVPANGGGVVTMPEINVTQTGYLYFYLSYDNNSGPDVYFDEFNIIYNESAVVVVNSYYPYGLQSFMWDRVGEEKVRTGFQGKEYEKYTGWNDFHARQYDGALGRWWSSDPANQYVSGYIGMGNNPVNGLDPNGKWFGWDDLAAAGIGFAAGYIGSGLKTHDWGRRSLIAGGAGALYGWLAYNTAGLSASAVAANGGTWSASNLSAFAINQGLGAISSQVNTTIQYGNFSFGMGLTASTSAIGANFSLAYADEHISLGLSVGSGEMAGTNDLSGKFFDASRGASFLSKGVSAGFWAKGKFYGASYGSTTVTGELSQTIGQIGLQINRLGIRLDEDFLGDKGDRFYTGGGTATYRLDDQLSVALGLGMITGDGDPITVTGAEWEHPVYDPAFEAPFTFRGGALYGGLLYDGNAMFLGVNSEKVLHPVQNGFFHTYVTKKTPFFPDLHYRSKLWSYFGYYSTYSLVY